MADNRPRSLNEPLPEIVKGGSGGSDFGSKSFEDALVAFAAEALGPAHVVSSLDALHDRADRDEQPSDDQVAQKVLPPERNTVAGNGFLNDGRVAVVEHTRLWYIYRFADLDKPLVPIHVRTSSRVEVHQVLVDEIGRRAGFV